MTKMRLKMCAKCGPFYLDLNQLIKREQKSGPNLVFSYWKGKCFRMFIIPSIKGARHSSVFCGIVWQTVFSLVGSQELLCVKTLRCIPDAWQTCASIFLIDFRFLGWRLNGSLCEKLYPCFTLSWLYSHFSHLFIDSLWYLAIQFHSIISIYVS